MAEILEDKNKVYNELKKEKEGLIHISFSEFSKFVGCGHKHLLEKYLKIVEDTTSIHLIFGNAIHGALESGIKKSLNQQERIENFKYNFVKEMNDQLRDSPEFDKVEEFAAQGENIIKILSIEKIIEKYEVISVEEPLYEKIYAQYRFKGFIDLILRNKETGRYLIIDWKTSTQPWDVSKKKKDEIFMSQMKLYKYFYAKKLSVPMELIDCKYIVLNRLKSKKLPELGFGGIQPVEIYSSLEDVEKSILKIAEVVKSIHIDKKFTKVKLVGSKNGCFFCPHKHNLTLCSNDPEQYISLLEEHGK